ncbi:MAG: peptidylprolyl isomerase [Flavobacteriales bacterium]|nr:peptidylprolyl isomerase [Flavobacteriales bacterium]
MPENGVCYNLSRRCEHLFHGNALRFLSVYGIFFITVFSAVLPYCAMAQRPGTLVDGVIAVVGKNAILKSDVEQQLKAMQDQGKKLNDNTACEVFEDLLFAKLLLNQADEDSVSIPEDQVEQEMERRLRFFINQFGSKEKLEEFYEKSIEEIKQEFRAPITEQMLVEKMKGGITSKVSVSPAEVKAYFTAMNKDSLLELPAEIEVAQIVKKPPVNEAEIEKTRQKIEELRQRVIAGEDFGTLAYLYSEDPGSARQNGELGFMNRGDLVPEFAAVAFSLDKGEVSTVVETDFGLHIIQMLERKGQTVNCRHILMAPHVQGKDLMTARTFLDSIKKLILTVDTLNFELAALRFSEDKETRYNGGLIINPLTGDTKFEMDQISQIDPSLYLSLDKLKPGQIAGPEIAQMRDGSKVYRLIYLKSVREAHTINISEDYQRLQQMALVQKQRDALNDWIVEKSSNFYVRLEDTYSSCPFRFNWIPPQKP